MPRTKNTKDNVKKTQKDTKKEKKDDNIIMPRYIIPFYTVERWQNWINQIKESDFKIDDKDKGAIFVYMTDDIILACLKLIAKYDKGTLQKEDATRYLSDIKDIALKKVDSINEDVDMMLESTQVSLMAVFVSCERYIEKNFERTKSFGKLINGAIQAEEKNDMGNVIDHISTIGANILAGEKLKDSDLDKVTSEGLVAEWLDGIDSLSAAMIGDTSYKYDEPDSGD